MSSDRLLLAAPSRGCAQFAQIPSFPGAGLVQVVVPCPNHTTVGHCCGRSMGICPRNAASDNQLCCASCHLQGGHFHLGTVAKVVPNAVGRGEPLAAGHCVVDLSEVDAADDDGNGASQQFSDLGYVVRFTPGVAHQRPCVEHNWWALRFQESTSSSAGKKYDDPSSRNTRTLMIPWRPKSTRVPGYIFLRAARSSRNSDMISSASGAMFSSQNFLNSAIAASFSSRGRKWNGIFAGSTGSRSFCSEGASRRATFSTSPILQKFHAIATLFDLNLWIGVTT